MSNSHEKKGTVDCAYFALQNISVGFNKQPLLTGVSLQLSKGEIGCLLGPSGCGKSTLLRVVAGFEKAQAGEVYLGGKCLNQRGREISAARRNIGMVFQDYSLFPHLNVLKNVQFGLHTWPKDKALQRATQCLHDVGLVHRLRAMPHELSGGEQQRVALARALAPQPALLLLDEPFSSLDLDLREKLGREMRAVFKASNTTALMVTHDQYEAFAMADKIGVINNNRLEQWDDAYHVYHQPVSQSVADFVGQGVFLRGVIKSRAQVATAIGEFTIGESYLHGLDYQPGDLVHVLLRPDDIIHDDASAMQARVTARYFRGAQFQYTLALPNAEKILVLVPSHHDHKIGESIGIRLEVDHVVVFPNN